MNLIDIPKDANLTSVVFLLVGLALVFAAVCVLLRDAIQKKKDDNLRKRLVSSFGITCLLLLPAYLGGLLFAGAVCILAICCLNELLNVVKVDRLSLHRFVGWFCIFGLVSLAFAESVELPIKMLNTGQTFLAAQSGASLMHSLHPFYIFPVFVIMLLLTVPVVIRRFEGMVLQESVTIFGVLYLGWFLGHLVLLRNLSGGFGYLIFLAACVVFNDVFAYAIGRLFGKTALAPAISPKKTVEGAVGGICGSLLAGSLFRFSVPDLMWPTVIGSSLLIGLAAPFGDLFISVIKRDMQVKDTGDVIPGHGGFLDRFDSLIFASPNFYYFLVLIACLDAAGMRL